MPSRFFFLFLIAHLAALPAFAALRSGRVVDRNGDPVPHCSVIVRETFEGARTDDHGIFLVELPESGAVTFIVTPPGKDAINQPIELHPEESIVLSLDIVANPQVNMEAVVVVGATSKPPPTVARGSTLTVVDVVTLPGVGTDLNRALQTLPGVQYADEGDALFVRGGDYWETGAFINGSLFPSAVRLERPTGTFVGTVNPFLTKKISFAAGGFGARYGNLLSGVVSVDTQDAPTEAEGTLNVGLGAVSAGGALPLGKTAGIRFAATRYDLGLTMRVNGSDIKFLPPPNGSDVSGSVSWAYRPGAEVKLFTIQQTNRFGVEVFDPTFIGFYAQQQSSHFSVLSIKDNVGPVAISGNVSTGQSHTKEIFGDLDIDTRLPSTRSFLQGTYAAFNDVSFTFGAEYERTGLRMAGTKPASFNAVGPGAASIDIRGRVDGRRNGEFLEADWIATQRLHVVAGVRTDRSNLTGERTIDPRLSVSYQVAKGVLLTSAVGIYHQVPDILFYNPLLGGGGLPPMRATHEIVGLQLGEENRQLRIEAYRKDYDQIDQFTRDRLVSRNGTGNSQGIDLFAKYPLPFGVSGRFTMSLLDAERTDPDTGISSRAAFGIRNSTTIILSRYFRGGYQAALTWRGTTGRPFTEITAANFDFNRWVFVPTYGPPNAARLPSYQRYDFNLSKLTLVSPKLMTVWYLSLSNVLGKKNVTGYSYSFDYQQRVVTPSIFNRSVYVGVSFIFR